MMEPWQRELLKKIDRTNELLEYLLMGLTPQKIMLGGGTEMSAEALRDFESRLNTAGQLAAEAAKGSIPMERALANAGIFPMSARVTGQPETPEQRAERFAARAKEVGLPEEQIAEVSGRVQLNLDTLTERDVVEAPLEQLPPPAKKAPAKKAARPAQ